MSFTLVRHLTVLLPHILVESPHDGRIVFFLELENSLIRMNNFSTCLTDFARRIINHSLSSRMVTLWCNCPVCNIPIRDDEPNTTIDYVPVVLQLYMIIVYLVLTNALIVDNNCLIYFDFDNFCY